MCGETHALSMSLVSMLLMHLAYAHWGERLCASRLRFRCSISVCTLESAYECCDSNKLYWHLHMDKAASLHPSTVKFHDRSSAVPTALAKSPGSQLSYEQGLLLSPQCG